MKLTARFSSLVLPALLVVMACTSKSDQSHVEEDGHGHDGAGVWEEMDDFHAIMAETFHPYKDSSNLEPAKRRASELMRAADKWASAELPARVNNEEVKAKLQQLKSEAAALAESVKSSDDNVIGDHLTRLHDTYHAIEEAWYSKKMSLRGSDF